MKTLRSGADVFYMVPAYERYSSCDPQKLAGKIYGQRRDHFNDTLFLADGDYRCMEWVNSDNLQLATIEELFLFKLES